MALTETEELELLELEAEAAGGSDGTSGGQYQPSFLEQASEGVESVMGPVGEAVAKVSNAVTPYLPPPSGIMQRIGGAVIPPVASGIEKAGEFVAERGSQAMTRMGVPQSVAVPVSAAAGMVTANAPYFAIPVGGPAGKMAGTASLARRALYSKQNLIKKLPGGVPQAEAVGMEMLDRGVLGPFASKETMLGRAGDIAEQSGNIVGQIPKVMGFIARRGINAESIADDIASQIAPKMERGAFAKDVNTLQEIVDTVKAAGARASFSDAQIIKQKLQGLGQFPKGQIVDQVTKDKILMYRKASGIFNKAMETAMERESPRLAASYKTAKATYGTAVSAEKALSDAYITESANVLPTLRGTIASGEALGRGELGRAAMLLGAFELASRKGAQMGAYTLGKALPSTALSPLARRAYISRYVDAIITKEGRQSRRQ